jgi:uncharacterized protein (TIGR02996 family)
VGRYRLGDQVWSIDQTDAGLAITEPDGVERTETFATAADAKRKFTILTSGKMRAGWKLVKDVETVVASPRTPIVHDARNPALEAALLVDPYDRDAWLIYGDWLQQQGDPRGEYIALRAGTLAAPHDALARDRFQRFAASHTERFGGHLGRLGWGFVDEVTLPGTVKPRDLGSDPARFVTKLKLAHATTFDKLVADTAPYLPTTVREIEFEGTRSLANIAPFAGVLARVHKLALHTRCTESCFVTLATTAMPELIELSVRQRQRTSEVLHQVLGRGDLPSLVRLHLDMPTDPALCAAIAQSPLAPQLRVLTLTHLDDASAVALVANLERFSSLAQLGIERERVSGEMIGILERGVGAVVETRSRYEPVRE